MRKLPQFLTMVILGTFSFVVAGGSVFAADIVLRKSTDSRESGTIKSQTQDGIVIESLTKKETTIPANDIRRVDWDGASTTLKLALNSEERGDLQGALTSYEKVLTEVDASNTNLKTDLEFLIARASGNLAKADPTKLADAIKKLDAYQNAHATTFRYYDCLLLLGDLYLLSEDYTAAQATFVKLDASKFDDYKMASKIAQGRLMLRKDNVPAAQKLFQEVEAKPANSDSEKSRKYEARLGLATCLQRLSKYDEAALELDKIIKEAPASDAKTMGEAYLRKGDNLLASSRPNAKKEALLAYLHVDVLFSSEKDLHAEALYHLAKLWNEVGQPGRAADARAILSSEEYKNSEWAKKN